MDAVTPEGRFVIHLSLFCMFSYFELLLFCTEALFIQRLSLSPALLHLALRCCMQTRFWELMKV